MKISKNMFLVLASYVGTMVLVASAALLSLPLRGASEGDGEITVGGGYGDELLFGDTASESASRDPETEWIDSVYESEEPPVTDVALAAYSVRTVVEEGESPVIVVYDGDGNLLRVLDTSPTSLPLSDQAALAGGITVSGEAALLGLLEDLGG